MPAPHRDMMQCWNEFAMILLVLFCFFLKCETRCGRRNEKCLGGSTLLNSFFNKKKKLCNECLTVVIAFDEGERILIVSFLRKFYGPVPRESIVMPCDLRHWAPFWTGGLAGWLAGYAAQIASILCANVFMAALNWGRQLQIWRRKCEYLQWSEHIFGCSVIWKSCETFPNFDKPGL